MLQMTPAAAGESAPEAKAESDDWNRLSLLLGTVEDLELLDTSLAPETLLWRLFHEEEEVRVSEGAPLAKGCRCDLAHIRDMIGRFPADERAEMAGDDGVIGVDCAFCSRIFPLALDSFNTDSPASASAAN